MHLLVIWVQGIMGRSKTYNNVKRRRHNHQSPNHREVSRESVKKYPLEHNRKDDLTIQGQGTPAGRFTLKTHGHQNLNIVLFQYFETIEAAVPSPAPGN
jgi:hypothetical protein